MTSRRELLSQCGGRATEVLARAIADDESERLRLEHDRGLTVAMASRTMGVDAKEGGRQWDVGYEESERVSLSSACCF